jgi:tryptophan synthase beta chain
MAGDDPDVVSAAPAAAPTSPASPSRSSASTRGDQAAPHGGGGATSCPTLTKGKFAYDFGDTRHLTPLTKMHTLGSTFTPPGFHAGGLRYHGEVILFNYSGHGFLDLAAYDAYNHGTLIDE